MNCDIYAEYGYYSAIKRSGVLTPAKARMNPESTKSDAKGPILTDSTQRDTGQMAGARVWGTGEESVFNGHGVLAWEGDTCLGTDGGFTTLVNALHVTERTLGNG